MQEMVNCHAKWVRVVFGGNQHDSVTKNPVHRINCTHTASVQSKPSVSLSGTRLRHHSQVIITANFKMSLFICHVTCCGISLKRRSKLFSTWNSLYTTMKIDKGIQIIHKKGILLVYHWKQRWYCKDYTKKGNEKKSYEWGCRRNSRVLFLYERTHMSSKN